MTWFYIGLAIAFILGAIAGGIGVGALVMHIVRNWNIEILIADGRAIVNPRFYLWPECD